MSNVIGETIKLCTACGQPALVPEITECMTDVPIASCQFDQTQENIES